MAIITDGSGSSGWKINSTGTSGNVKLVDSNGNELGKPPSTGNSYVVNFSITQTTTTAAGLPVWHMRNLSGGSTSVRIRAIRGNVGCDVTAAVATVAKYGFYRTNTATPTGGATVTPSKKNTGMGSTVVTDVRFVDTGLTVGSLVKETDAMCVVACARGVGQTSIFNMTYETLEVASSYMLLNGEGLGIYLMNVAVAGDMICGQVEYDETTLP